MTSIVAATVGLLGSAAHAAPGDPAGWRVLDDEGRVLALSAPARRIVSLAPGATALLFAAGAGERVVGTAEYSFEPDAARTIERVGDAHGVDVEHVLALHPDVVVAWPAGGSQATIAQLERLGVPVYRHRLQRLDELAPDIERLGRLAGSEARAQAAAASLSARIGALRAAHARATPHALLVQLWDQPVFTIGGAQVLGDVLAACGWRNAFGELAGASPVVSVEAVVARDPDAILALGDAPDGTGAWLDRWRAFGSMRAVRSGRLWSWSDPRLTRMGPAIVDGAEALCAALDAGMPYGSPPAAGATPAPTRPAVRPR